MSQPVFYSKVIQAVEVYGSTAFEESAKSQENYHKWLAIWSMGLVGEIGELVSALGTKPNSYVKEELADVTFYLVGLDKLIGFNYIANYSLPITDPFCDKSFQSTNLVFSSIAYLEQIKKYLRDYPLRDVKDCSNLIKVYEQLCKIFYLDERVGHTLLNKLAKRYPNGYFDKTASVNRDNTN